MNTFSCSYNSSLFNILKNKNGSLLFTFRNLVKLFGEYYEVLTSDITGHSLDRKYWQECLGPPSTDTIVWNILMVHSKWMRSKKLYNYMQCNKFTGLDGLQVEFYKAFFETSVNWSAIDYIIDLGDPSQTK